jgi:SAM-dependent methyltransferase
MQPIGKGSDLQAKAALARNTRALKNTVHNFYEWNLRQFPIEKHRRILDVGCGQGLYLDLILCYLPSLYYATDYQETIVMEMAELMKDRPNCKTALLDLSTDDWPDSVMNERFDYLFCFDVLEHIENHDHAIRKIHRLMTATSARYLFLRVPAHPFLYGRNDSIIGHFRRYRKTQLAEILRSHHFSIRSLHYQNFAGILPWFTIGRVFRRSLAVSPQEGRLFNALVPLFSSLEARWRPPAGLSLCATAEIAK